MQCTKCGRDIPAGADCLSQLPRDLPPGIHRSDYRNFCVGCFEWADSTPVPCCTLSREHLCREKAADPVSCHHCQETVPRNAWAFCWTFFDWPKSSRARSAPGGAEPPQGVGATPWIGGLHRGKGGWNNLSPNTQRRFRTRGLGRGLAPRSPTEARKFFEGSIPKSIRAGGDKSVRRFMRGRDASHIESVKQNRDLARTSSNMLWENAGRNRSRGARNMTESEVARAKAETRRAGYAELGRSVAKQAAWTAAIELFVASLENWFHWKRGRKTGKQAAGDAARSTGASLGTAVVMVALAPLIRVVVLFLALLGILLAIAGVVWHEVTGASLAIPVAIGGAVLTVLTMRYALNTFLGTIRFAINAFRRVARAARHDGAPLDEFRVIFCARCILQEQVRPRVGPDVLEWNADPSPSVSHGQL